jgi:hypothetical protein
MIPVFQDKTVKNDGHGNCFHACVASILELPLRKVANFTTIEPGEWFKRWAVWLGDRGFKLTHSRGGEAPSGYSIATVFTERTYPADHPLKPGARIAHACVAFDGVVVHDPYPLPTQEREIRYYAMIVPLTESEQRLHNLRVQGGRCIHGYLSSCGTCPQLDATTS